MAPSETSDVSRGRHAPSPLDGQGTQRDTVNDYAIRTLLSHQVEAMGASSMLGKESTL